MAFLAIFSGEILVDLLGSDFGHFGPLYGPWGQKIENAINTLKWLKIA
jgi:hypothetical protein